MSSPAAPIIADGPWWRGYTTAGGVAVVHLDLRPHASHERNAYGWLDREERSRLGKFQIPGAGRRFTLCRAALRTVLSSQLDCPIHSLSFDTSHYGKPFALVAGERVSLRFNVSHSGNHGLIALSRDSEVGVDVEERSPRRDLEGLIETVMGPEETEKLLSLKGEGQLHLFYRIWTMKEALAKAAGTGLYTDFAAFQAPEGMLLGDTVSEFRFPGAQSPTWRLLDLGAEDFAAALACEKTADSPASS